MEPAQGLHCGGTLVAPGWVLTAAHCVAGDSEDAYYVLLGQHDRSGTGGERIAISEIRVHPHYDPITAAADVAVLELEHASAQQPIALATPADDPPVGAFAAVAGWGCTTRADPDDADACTTAGEYPQYLQTAELQTVSDSQCAAVYPVDFIPTAMLCAAFLTPV